MVNSLARPKAFRAVVVKNIRSRRASELLAGPAARRTISARPRPKKGRPALSSYQSQKANQRGLWLEAAFPLFKKHRSASAVAAAIGLSAASLSRLLNSAPVSHMEKIGNLNAAEKCRRLIAAGRVHLAPDVAPGRISAFDALLNDADIVQELKGLYIETLCESGQPIPGRRPGSIALALKRLGDFPVVPARLAGKLQSGCKPKPLVEFLKRTYSPVVAAKFFRYGKRIAGGKIFIQINGGAP